MSDPTYPLFPVFSFLGFVLALVPLPWHLQAWNAGTCIYMFWTSLGSLAQFVDSVVWHGRMDNIAPVWCDISSKFIIGAGVGIPAASLCINRRLYSIAAVQHVSISQQTRRRNVYLDLAIGLGVPVIVMCLHTVVQGHRFNIAEDIGCLPETYVTPVAFPLVFMWPVLLGCVSFIYASLTLRAFWLRRLQFRELLASTPSMSISRYFRLMLLSIFEMALTIPLGVYSIYVNISGVDIAPWISWADTHFDFSRVGIIPAAVWRAHRNSEIAIEMGRWIYPCAGLLFFSLFGFAEEARRHYRAAFWFVAKVFGIKPVSRQSTLAKWTRPSRPEKFSASPSSEALPAYAPSVGAHIVVQKCTFTMMDIDLEKTGCTTSSFCSEDTRYPTYAHNPHHVDVPEDIPFGYPPSPSTAGTLTESVHSPAPLLGSGSPPLSSSVEP